MKIKNEHVYLFALLLIGGLYFGIFSFDFNGWNFPSGNIGGGGGGGTGGQAVTKPVIFTVTDKYAGSALASQTVYVYDDKMSLLETLTTDSSGQKYTSASYQSGTELNVLVVGGAAQERCWYKVIVPTMSAADADSLTQNPVALEFYDYTAPTLTVINQAGSSIADAGNYNLTVSGTTAILTVSWYQGTEGNGYMSSYDPIYQMRNDALLVLKLSNTNYETITVTGMSGGIERASAKYFYKVIPAEELTKWKVGNTFRYPGVGSTTVSLDLSTYTGDACDADFYIYYFGDWNYWLQNGAFGPNQQSVLSGAPHTVNLID